MKSPLVSGEWIELHEVDSTQLYAQKLLSGQVPGAIPGVIISQNQTAGVGRFDRKWYSEPDRCLTISFVFQDYPDHPKPWLIGMAVALACAGAIHCRVSWPNDLIHDGKKLGGVLTQLFPNARGQKIAVVGVGINLNLETLPSEIAEIATSLTLIRPGVYDPKAIARQILDRIETMPEPGDWSALRPIWSLFDSTPGKKYRLPTGEMAVGIGLGPEGELMCAVDGETHSVMAADAIFGTNIGGFEPAAK